MSNSLFDFFEIIADELSAEESRIITRFGLQVKDEESPFLDDLKRQMKIGSTEDAIRSSVEALQIHFEAKGAKLPFAYDPDTGRFTAVDTDFLSFVCKMSSIRSIGKKAHDFECCVAERLGQRTTGTIHRVGHPRDIKTKKADFNAHLHTLGFGGSVLLDREKDGGLDILWLLPIGTIPHRPIVSVQCKNGEFDIDVADTSLGAASRSLSEHAGLQLSVHVPCVFFNDYIYPDIITKKKLNFVPLGLTDLSTMEKRISVECI